MYVEAKRRKFREESLMVFGFSSIEDDFAPFIAQLQKYADSFRDERDRNRFLELIHKIESRCDDKYATDNAVITSALFADEAAAFMMYTSYLLAFCFRPPSKSTEDK